MPRWLSPAKRKVLKALLKGSLLLPYHAATAATAAPLTDPTSALLHTPSLDDQELKPQPDIPPAKPAVATGLFQEETHAVDRTISSTRFSGKRHGLHNFTSELGTAVSMQPARMPCHLHADAASSDAAAAPQADDKLVTELDTTSLGIAAAGALDTASASGHFVSIPPSGILPQGPAGWQASDAASSLAPATLMLQANQPAVPEEQNAQQLQHGVCSPAASCAAAPRQHAMLQPPCTSGMLQSLVPQERLQDHPKLPVAAVAQPAAPRFPAQHSLQSLEASPREGIAASGQQECAEQVCDASHQHHSNTAEMGDEAHSAASHGADLGAWELDPLSSRLQSGRPCDPDAAEQERLAAAQHTAALYSDSASAGTAPLSAAEVQQSSGMHTSNSVCPAMSCCPRSEPSAFRRVWQRVISR